jgi:cyclophilin family peptidyl-prolyl cis-trans isomerase
VHPVYRGAALLLVAAAAVAGCGGGDDKTSAKPSTTTAATRPASSGCRKMSTPEPKPNGGERPPRARLSAGVTYDVRLDTNCGSFTIRVDQRRSPATAASFVSLARKGFFDHTTFHRIVPGFVIQGGDPTGTGTGGPGYSTRDVPAHTTAYTKGVVAMAKTGAEPAGTAGSQFYVVTGADAGLQPDYAVLGKVVKGLAVTDRIGKLGDPSSGESGTPLEPVVISKATVSARR